MTRAVQVVSGKDKVQLLLVKTQSSFSNKGGLYMLDQVNFFPYNGISVRPRWLIVLLKRNISLESAPSLFLFSGYL